MPRALTVHITLGTFVNKRAGGGASTFLCHTYTGSFRYYYSPSSRELPHLPKWPYQPPAFLRGFFLGMVSYHGNEMRCAFHLTLTENVREFIANTQYTANLPAVLLKQNSWGWTMKSRSRDQQAWCLWGPRSAFKMIFIKKWSKVTSGSRGTFLGSKPMSPLSFSFNKGFSDALWPNWAFPFRPGGIW